jgi:hypothetical protein
MIQKRKWEGRITQFMVCEQFGATSQNFDPKALNLFDANSSPGGSFSTEKCRKISRAGCASPINSE